MKKILALIGVACLLLLLVLAVLFLGTAEEVPVMSDGGTEERSAPQGAGCAGRKGGG